MQNEAPSLKVQLMHVENGVGRVLIGPKKLSGCYARIVSQKDGSGRIEKFDFASRSWLEAPVSVTFSEVWSAPAANSMVRAEIDYEKS
jgi:hypothetical protein